MGNIVSAYLGEIRLFAGSYAPAGWALCNGAILSVNDYEDLYSLIGTTYGGDGRTTFALPDMQSRIPIHQGQGVGLTDRLMGQRMGVEYVTLTANQTPTHSHTLNAIKDTTQTNPSVTPATTSLLATGQQFFAPASNPVQLANNTIGNSPGGSTHNNIMPVLALTYVICMIGNYPPKN